MPLGEIGTAARDIYDINSNTSGRFNHWEETNANKINILLLVRKYFLEDQAGQMAPFRPVLYRFDLSRPVLSWPVPTCPVLAHPDLSCPGSFHPVPSRPLLSRSVPYRPDLVRPVPSCPVLACLVLYRLVLTRLNPFCPV